MKNKIINLADDIELEDDRRKMFIEEMNSIIPLIREDDYDQFYAIADVIMQKHMNNETT